MQQSKRDLFFWYSLILCAFTFAYVLLRAIYVNITYDEVWTLYSFVRSSVVDVLTFANCDANNHILNTLLIKLLYSTVPNTVFIARLPNVLAALVYLYFAYKFSARLSSNSKYFALIALLLNPFLLEFFSLARGYGLAMACVICTLYFLQNYSSTKKTAELLKTLLSLLLLSLSMLSSLHLVVPAFALLLYYATRSKQKQALQVFFIFLFIVATVALLWLPIKQLRANDSFYYGGHNNFFSDTIVSLAKYFFGTTYADTSIIVVSVLAGSAALLLIVFQFKHAGTQLLQTASLSALLLLTIASVISQFYLLKSPYVTDRTALFFYPLLVCALASACTTFESSKVIEASQLVLTIIFASNFSAQGNLYKTLTWFFDAHSAEIIRIINQHAGGKACSAQLSWPLRKSLEYYRDKNFPNLQLDYKNPLQALRDGDYVIFLNSTIDQVDYQAGYDVLVQYNKDTLARFEKEKLYVFKLSTKQ